MKYCTILTLGLLFATKALAEYRVYQYYVQPNSTYPTKAQSTIETSTLDPVTYKAYHGGTATKIDLVRTWLCPGYTGDGRPPCEDAKDVSANTTGGPSENR